jgi:hypothetical protein
VFRWFQIRMWNKSVFISELLPLRDILFIPQMIYEYGEWWWNYIDRENRRTRRKTCPSATLSTTNATWIDPGTNQGLRGERPVTNCLSHCTALPEVSLSCCSWFSFISAYQIHLERELVVFKKLMPVSFPFFINCHWCVCVCCYYICIRICSGLL